MEQDKEERQHNIALTFQKVAKKVPWGEILWGKETHEGESMYALCETIKRLDDDECAVTITEADDPTPYLLSIPTLKRLVAEYERMKQDSPK